MVHAPASLLLVCALALTTVSAQCVIATPQDDMKVSHHYTVEFTGCTGEGKIDLRYGDVTNLETSDHPACEDVDFASGHCTFTPKKAGDYSFSAIDATGVETFTGRFSVVKDKKRSSNSSKASETPKTSETKTSKTPKPKTPKTPKTSKSSKGHDGKVPVESKKPGKVESTRAINAQKRALYDLAAFAL